MLRDKRLHAALLVIGLAFLFAAAFSGYFWFDESYTFGLITHSLAQIWTIDAFDVHPPLYYEVVRLLLPVLDNVGTALARLASAFGVDAGASLGSSAPAGLSDRIAGLRAFSIGGMWLTAWLGYTFLRRDLGARAGFLFSLAVLFAPMLVELSSQVRMYSWACFCVMTCFIAAERIAVRVAAGERAGLAAWFALVLSGLAAAYLHYYGAFTAFAINALLVVHLIRGLVCSAPDGPRASGARRACAVRALGIWAVSSIVQVVAYLPWLAVVIAQAKGVSSGFWISWEPLGMAIGFAWPLAVFATLVSLAHAGVRLRSVPGAADTDASGTACQLSRPRRQAVVDGMLVYVIVLAGSMGVSVAMGHPVVLERYLAIPLVPALASLAVLADEALRAPASHPAGDLSDLDASGAIGARDSVTAVRVRTIAVACLAVALVGSGVARQAGIVSATYGASGPLDYFDDLTRAKPHARIMSDSINIAGVFAVARPDTDLHFMNEWGERTSCAYQAFAPTMSIVGSWSEMPVSESDPVVYLGSSSARPTEDGLCAVEQAIGMTVEGWKAWYRPVENRWFFIAEGAASPSVRMGE